MIRRRAGTALPILRLGSILASLSMLIACGGDELPTANQTGPVKIKGEKIRNGDSSALPGTPMEERVAVIGLLNKRNGITTDLTMKPGDALRAGDAIVRLQACETSAPWKMCRKPGPLCSSTSAAPPTINGAATFPAGCSRNGPTAMSCSTRSMTSGSKAARCRGPKAALTR